ncbi:MAG: glyceraldehyde-3-phosphate dehydrogenase [Bacteroidota bacterium]
MDSKIVTSQEINARLSHWREEEKKALDLLNIVGDLRFDQAVELLLFRRTIYDCRPSEVLNNHKFVKNYAPVDLFIDLTLSITRYIADMKIKPSRIDIGTLATEWLSQQKRFNDLTDFLEARLGSFRLENEQRLESRDVVLYGFGRIGRLACRRLIEMTGRGEQLCLKAIVLRAKIKDNPAAELKKRANLLRMDSVHGAFPGIVEVDAEHQSLIINGQMVKVIFASHPSDIDYTRFGIQNALVIDNTGAWRDREGLSQHLRLGVDKVLFTAPGKGIPNIVHGVNHQDVDPESEKVYCAASCTTNAIAPILNVVHDQFGIERGHIESIHSYTSSQNLLDNFHKKPRRGRAAAVNMVITSTGAASAIAKVIPDLSGILTGSAIRVPTPNVSLAILSLDLKNETSAERINKAIQEAAYHGSLVEQIQYSINEDFVSSDVVGSTATSVFDAPSTKVTADGKKATMYVWYDNEFGYTCQVLRLAKYLAQVRRHTYY